jgi:hypothetical protein
MDLVIDRAKRREEQMVKSFTFVTAFAISMIGHAAEAPVTLQRGQSIPYCVKGPTSEEAASRLAVDLLKKSIVATIGDIREGTRGQFAYVSEPFSVSSLAFTINPNGESLACVIVTKNFGITSRF